MAFNPGDRVMVPLYVKSNGSRRIYDRPNPPAPGCPYIPATYKGLRNGPGSSAIVECDDQGAFPGDCNAAEAWLVAPLSPAAQALQAQTQASVQAAPVTFHAAKPITIAQQKPKGAYVPLTNPATDKRPPMTPVYAGPVGQPAEGCQCMRCRDINPYASPNQAGGAYLCGQCMKDPTRFMLG